MEQYGGMIGAYGGAHHRTTYYDNKDTAIEKMVKMHIAADNAKARKSRQGVVLTIDSEEVRKKFAEYYL